MIPMTPTSHRQRVGKDRTRYGLRPTLADVRKALNERRCAEHGPDSRGFHEAGDGRGWTGHAVLGFLVFNYSQAEPLDMAAAPEGSMANIPSEWPFEPVLDDVVSRGPW